MISCTINITEIKPKVVSFDLQWPQDNHKCTDLEKYMASFFDEVLRVGVQLQMECQKNGIQIEGKNIEPLVRKMLAHYSK